MIPQGRTGNYLLPVRLTAWIVSAVSHWGIYMDNGMLQSAQFGGMSSLVNSGSGSSGSDMTGLAGPLGSSGTPSVLGAGNASMPAGGGGY